MLTDVLQNSMLELAGSITTTFSIQNFQWEDTKCLGLEEKMVMRHLQHIHRLKLFTLKMEM